MNKKYKVEYLPSAVSDLTNIIKYIKLDSPKNVITLLNRIDKAILSLETFPYAGIIPKDVRLGKLNYRILIIDNYLGFYVVLDDIVEIRRIIFGRRRYEFLL